jgi:hypothetical protein
MLDSFSQKVEVNCAWFAQEGTEWGKASLWSSRKQRGAGTCVPAQGKHRVRGEMLLGN